QVLRGENMRDVIRGMEDSLIDEALARYCAADEHQSQDWDLVGLRDYLERLCVKPGTVEVIADAIRGRLKEDADAFLKKEAARFYEEREQQITEIGIEMRELERSVLLRSVDIRWMDHIDAMDQLRDGIGLRAYGQKDPVNEYKLESYDMFEEMVHLIREDTVRTLCQARIERAQERRAVARATQERGSEPVQEAPHNPVKAAKKIGRNDPCPCGSGKKYKNCCGKTA
ncbi:MAG: SEC-C domain-containing protein, partial [Clostridia bacterium]|nr:SEC-C domain-containing protein [Clostridia bacterium]